MGTANIEVKASRYFFSQTADRNLAFLGMLGGVVFLTAFGILGLFRSAPFGLDFSVFHKAAVIFLNGGNPWQAMAQAGDAFAYPPHAASLMAIYGFMPESVALTLHTAVNIFSIIVIACLLNLWFFKIREFSRINLAQGAGLALFIGNPFMAHIVFEGQIALPAAACVFLSWHYLKLHRWVWAGVFLGCATIKPQIAILYIVWLLFSFQFRVLTIGALTALLLSIPAFIVFGPIDSYLFWFESLAFYKTVGANIPGSFHVVGFESLFAALGVEGTGGIFKVMSVLSLAIIFYWQKHIPDALLVQLLLVLSFTFIFGHDTGYAVVVGIFSMLLTLVMARGFSWRLIPAIAVILVFFFPQRFLREIPLPILHHTRTLILPIACWMTFLYMPKITKYDA